MSCFLNWLINQNEKVFFLHEQFFNNVFFYWFTVMKIWTSHHCKLCLCADMFTCMWSMWFHYDFAYLHDLAVSLWIELFIYDLLDTVSDIIFHSAVPSELSFFFSLWLCQWNSVLYVTLDSVLCCLSMIWHSPMINDSPIADIAIDTRRVVTSHMLGRNIMSWGWPVPFLTPRNFPENSWK